MQRISIEKLPDLFALIAEKMPLYLPIRRDGQLNFELWQSGAEVDLDALKTVMSPKEFFMPEAEVLYGTAAGAGEFQILPKPPESRPFALFGVRACDAAGMKILDSVFLSEPVDEFYKARREAATMIVLACNKPGFTCFCKAFEIDAAAPEGDVAAWLTDSGLYWRALTEKGEKLTSELNEQFSEELGGLFEDTDDSAVQAAQEAIRKEIDALPNNELPLTRFTPENLLELFDSERWSKFHNACIACGTCTFLCPTCHCYDVESVDTGKQIQRRRCWDSCMYSDFTQMAHGNPRPTHKERFRQRFMHKLVYYPEKFGGIYACVGCGRCVNKCPVNLNIIKVINILGVTDNE